MDTKTLIRSLRALFSSENKIEKKYTKVWLFSGFGYSKDYTVHVQYDNPIAREHEEKSKLEKLIREKIEGSSKRVDGVTVHYFKDGYYRCRKEDILVYDDLNDPHLNYYSY